MQEYPSTLPNPENTPGGEVGVGLRRTTVPAALANQEKAFNSPAIFLDMSFTMDNDTHLVWVTWMLANGHTWFLMDVISPHRPVNIFSQHRARLVSEIAYQKLGDNWGRVSATFQVLPADRDDPDIPAAEYDWIVAGAPAAPATDIIQAGTPAAPATDVVRSHLYYWDR